MATIPVPRKVGGNFLDGDGNFQLSTDQNIWTQLVARGEPFHQGIDSIAEVRFGVDTKRDFTFGRTGSFALALKVKANALHQVHLLWPGEDDALLRQYGLTAPEKALYARVVMDVQTEVGAAAPFPLGPLSATVGVTAGGSVSYERWTLQDAATPAVTVLRDLYDGIRLPQHIDSLDEVPAPGELLLTRFGGYLHLNAGLNWGYSISGSRSIDANKLELDLNSKLRVMAAVSFGYKLAGDFQIEARRGEDSNWVRFAVRKSRETQTGIAADFGVDGDIQLKGLPESADSFLAQLFGADPDRLVELFGQGQSYTSLEGLEKAAGKLLNGALHRYSEQAFGFALSNATFQQFLDRMRAAASAYANIDKRVIDLYHAVLDEKQTAGTSKITDAIDLILARGTREQLLALSGKSELTPAIDLLRRLYSERVFGVLQKNDEFNAAVGLLKTAQSLIKGEADGEITKWIGLLKAQVPVDGLLKQLSQLTNPAQIRGIADERLQGLVEQLVGKAFDRLEDSDIDDVLGMLRTNLKQIDAFKNKWYERVQNAVQQSFQAKLHVAFTRTHKNGKLLEVDVCLAHPRGPELARKAAAGDFFELFANYDPGVAVIRQGLLTDELHSAAELQVNVLGWGMNGIVTLVQQSEHAIESQSGGLLHVYTSRAYVERKIASGWRFKEEVHSKFLTQAIGETLQAAGSGFRPYAADLLKSMTADYSLLQKDENTTVAELAEYLGFAAELGLLSEDPRAAALRIQEECDGDLGNVEVSYQVRFATEELRSVFRFSGDSTDPDGGTLGKLARNAMRRFMLRRYAAMDARDWLPRIGFAYCSPQAYAWYREATLRQKLKGVVLPGWLTGKNKETEVGLTGEMVALVERMFRYEDAMVKSLLALDKQVDSRTVDFAALNHALGELMRSAKDLGEYDNSCFPAILDSLIQSASGAAARRDSTMILLITPRKGKIAGRTITKVLAMPPRNPTAPM